MLPETASDRREDYVFNVLVTGFGSLVQKAREAGDWKVPKAYVSLEDRDAARRGEPERQPLPGQRP